ncbi:MAG TPA: DUF4097 family beta strand repeat-containing protein [Acidobacteriota bacterium]|nr:DUF4097 family beta strand repeat-containing protein [Acidobacteriota bacterium]
MKRTFAILSALLVAFVLVVPALGQVETRDFQVGAQDTLRLEVERGDVVVNVGAGSRVSVRAHGLDVREAFETYQRGGEVVVEYRPSRLRQRGGNRRWWNSGGGERFEIDLPDTMNIDMSTAGGDVTINGNPLGTVRGKTAGGDIDVGNIGGYAELKTAGGDINVGDVQSEAELKTSGGDIEVRNVGGRLVAKTSGGSVEVGNVGGDAELKTAGGDVRAQTVSGSVEMTTAGGDVELEAGFGHVRATTAGGDVELREVTGSVEAKTAGGTVRVRLTPEGSRQSELTTAGGDIELDLAGGGGVTIEAEIQDADEGGGWFRRGRGQRYDIRSDFEAASYEYDENSGRVYAVYQINGGGTMVRLKTAAGDIYIRRAAQ